MNQKYYCNPVNVNYRYQFHPDAVCRESADPSMIYYGGKYYVFASMTLGMWTSSDLVNWENHRLPDSFPLYSYAPDVRAAGEYVYFCWSSDDGAGSFYRTKDVLHGPYEEIPGALSHHDPHMLFDDDGRVYFYWGCSDVTPIWGVELQPDTMQPVGQRVDLLSGHPDRFGYERFGENHADPAQPPYIEGPWVTKHDGRYYLQYACPGTQFNIYADGVYVADAPLGPYVPAKNNPFSYNPGGFFPGAGHGSSCPGGDGIWRHIATMRISVNHLFERRVGFWPMGWDADGEMYCDQRYGDWPRAVSAPAWQKPEWYLLSYRAAARASSFEEGRGPANATDEDVTTRWRAASNRPGEWLEIDLGAVQDVRAVQINLADDRICLPVPGNAQGGRYVDDRPHRTRWILEGSEDGERYAVIEDKSRAETDLTHDLAVREEGFRARYLKLTVLESALEQPACISGLRAFGFGQDAAPAVPAFTARRTGPMDMEIAIAEDGAVGHNVLWGHAPDKLYHSCLTFENRVNIGALVAGQEYWVRVDAFNRNGITEGETRELKA